MNDNHIINRNLLALGMRHPDLVAQISQVSCQPNIQFIRSRTGLPVPILSREGRLFPMHSRFNPQEEGERIAKESPEGFLIAFGLGGAYHLLPLLQRKSLTGLIIVEKDIHMVRSILENINLTPLLSDSRVIMLVDISEKTLNQTILERYLPVLYGDLGTIYLRTRWESEPKWFSKMESSLHLLPEALSRDYTVQRKFGRRWFIHTIANIERSERFRCVLPPSRKLLITAAGPSLQEQLPLIHKMKQDGGTLLATDTSLPVLNAAKIIPNIILSIDCQAISYYHFFTGVPKESILVLDLASPPLLTRLTDKILFYSSGHPFSLYLNKYYRPFPIIDISGGNVTYGALSLAQAIGAREVHLFGGDFSYPNGRPYAQNTYIFPYFHSQSTRIKNSESGFWNFIANSHPRREAVEYGWRWRTSTLDHYKKSLEELIEGTSYNFIPAKGEGLSIKQIKNRTISEAQSHMSTIVATGYEKQNWKQFLTDYQTQLQLLPPLKDIPQDYLEGLSLSNKQVWATVLPIAATFRDEAENGAEAVEMARRWILERIQTIFNRSA